MGTVERVVDGDTLDATVAGKSTRIRLLNIDTPEVARDGHAGECLADEATAELEELLPVGTGIILDYDVERTDRYGRTLARVTRDDGIDVNRALVKAGLATPVTFGRNGRYRGEMDRAYEAAQAREVGFFDPEQNCPPPRSASSRPTTTPGATRTPSATPAPTRTTAPAAAQTPAAVEAEVVAGDPAPEPNPDPHPNHNYDPAPAQPAAPQVPPAPNLPRAPEAPAVPAAPNPPAPAPAQQAPAPAPKNPYPGYTGPRCYEPGGKVWHPC